MFGKHDKKKLEEISAGLLFRIHRLKVAVDEAQEMVRLAIRVHGYGSVVHHTNVTILARRTKELGKCSDDLAVNNQALILSR